MKITQVLILAAGEGLRMRPLTNNQPKPLIKVNGVSMLDRILKKLEELPQITKIVVNGFYLADKLENHLKSLNNPKIIFSNETSKLETGGGLLQALKFFDENQPIIIINGDIIWQNNDVLQSMLNNFDLGKMDILLGLKDKNSFLGYDGNGDFNLKNGEVTKDKINNFVYTGIQIFNLAILKKHKLPEPPFSLNYFFSDLSKIKGTELSGNFFHIGTPEALESFSKLIPN